MHALKSRLCNAQGVYTYHDCLILRSVCKASFIFSESTALKVVLTYEEQSMIAMFRYPPAMAPREF